MQVAVADGACDGVELLRAGHGGGEESGSDNVIRAGGRRAIRELRTRRTKDARWRMATEQRDRSREDCEIQRGWAEATQCTFM